MGDFIAEFIGEMILAPLFNALMAGLWWALRTGMLLAIYPVMLFTGWLRLWIRAKGRLGFGALWQQQGYAGLHRFGWQAAALDVERLLAAGLIVMAGGGIGLVLYALAGLWF